MTAASPRSRPTPEMSLHDYQSSAGVRRLPLRGLRFIRLPVPPRDARADPGAEREAGARRGRAGEGQRVTTGDTDLGKCCVCETEGPTVCNVLMLPFRSPKPGIGCWG